jgi:hypothetical protein
VTLPHLGLRLGMNVLLGEFPTINDDQSDVVRR